MRSHAGLGRLAVTVVSVLSPVVLWVAAESRAGAPTLLEHLGIRVGMSGLAQLMAVALPLALNATLFAGPLLQQLYDDGLPGPSDLGVFLTDWTNIRATIIAPITEEVVFRSCMVPLLVPALGRGPALYWGTALSGSISTILTILSWICAGIYMCGALPSPVCA